jgi:hypothetical protein
MGFGSIKKAFKKVAKVASFGAYRGGGGGGGAPEAPTPAPELELTNPEGEAEKKEETEKVQLRKGKKGLRIKKAGNADVSAGAGRNLV